MTGHGERVRKERECRKETVEKSLAHKNPTGVIFMSWSVSMVVFFLGEITSVGPSFPSPNHSPYTRLLSFSPFASHSSLIPRSLRSRVGDEWEWRE